MLDYNMNSRGNTSLYEYLYFCIRKDIEQGTLAPQVRMPSKRALAQHLGVSAITVENAYAQLVAEGYLYSRPRSGYFVSTLPFVAAPAIQLPAGLISGGAVGGATECEALAPTPSDEREAVDTFTGDAARLWTRALRAVLSSTPDEELYAPAPVQGTLRLRRAIANYLRQTRGMRVAPSNIVVGAGAQVLDVFLAQFLGAGKHWAVEDPGYLRLTRLYEASGLRVSHIALDAEGVNVAALEASGASVVHVMPSHQFPTGVVTSIVRRYELLSWSSAAPGHYIIEDDYDCEFRLAGKPIPSLQSIDTTGRVIYTNTFSKSLSSALRLAYMVLPEPLMAQYRQTMGFYSSTLSTVQQTALAHILETGDYERHVNRMRKRARDRRDALMAALQSASFAPHIRIEAADAGLHFLVAVDRGFNGEEVLNFLSERGAHACALDSFAYSPSSLACTDGFFRYVVRL